MLPAKLLPAALQAAASLPEASGEGVLGVASSLEAPSLLPVPAAAPVAVSSPEAPMSPLVPGVAPGAASSQVVSLDAMVVVP